MTKKSKSAAPAPEPAAAPPAPKAATRRGYHTCCGTCARKTWCAKNPTKGRQACSAERRGPECMNLIQCKWCTVCALHVGQAELDDPNQTKMFADESPAIPGAVQ